MDEMVSAPAKIILLGEHAVVYGKPALAVPLSVLRAYAKVIRLPSRTGLSIVAADLGNQEFVIDSLSITDPHPLVTATWILLNHLGASPPNAKITLHSDIPSASGMGSGAAITTALFRALLNALNTSLPVETLNELVYKVEIIYHGTPSGVDNTVVVFEKPIYFVKSQPIERLRVFRPLTFLVADTGISSSTKLAVADVRSLYDRNELSTNKILSSIAEKVALGRHALATGDTKQLGALMNENHKLLQQLAVSSPELDNLVNVAQMAGAFGAKLTGGGRGGNMIALVDENRADFIKTRLLQSGAVKVYRTEVI